MEVTELQTARVCGEQILAICDINTWLESGWVQMGSCPPASGSDQWGCAGAKCDEYVETTRPADVQIVST